ncbi:MAG: glycosyltransferase, partial [Bacteroidales bacterium]|nr:glycosyltransferase [Bacteroidales bacterium]
MIEILSKDHSRLSKKDLKKELVITVIITLFTLILTYFYTRYLIDNFLPIYHKEANNRYIFEYILFLVITSVLVYGSLIYEFCRLGYLIRILKFEEPDKTEVDNFLFKTNEFPSIKILVPSYQEEESTIYQTLFSAATQDYPEKNVVLLIDDSPNPKNIFEKKGLELSRKIPLEIMVLLSKEKEYLLKQYQDYKGREKKDIKKEKEYLQSNFHYVSNWFLDMANEYKINSHTDNLFVQKILIEPGKRLKKEAKSVMEVINDFENIELNYKKLISIFNAELSSFERKKYINLSQEPNKAMNINSYISLMGYFYNETQEEFGLFIQKKKSINGLSDKKIGDSDYILTLDADSIIVPEYTKNLIFMMEQKKFEKVAIIQSPYSAIDGTENLLERIAGATTDIQYIIHQGFTFFNSTFWVGANAIIRKKALDDIKETVEERGFKIERFISDKTVIEDTESSIDLVNKKWSLYNYPRRLSYSATPPDYGSLLIQRRRWANGGVIIFPKLFTHLLKNIFKPLYFFKVGFVRSH